MVKNKKNGVFFFITAFLLYSFLLITGGFRYKVFAEDFCFTVIADGVEYRYFYPQIYYSLENELVFCGLDKEVERIVANNKIEPINATVKFNPLSAEPFTLVRGSEGRGINGERLKKDVAYALISGKTQVVVKSQPIQPKIRFADLKKQTLLRAEFQTDYSFSSEERKNNVNLAVNFISGTVLQPNEQFSFNQVVGARTVERGFLPAKVIQDGKFIEGVGGGVCQVSTTLYNCVLKAGLLVNEVNRHTLQVGYATPSFDAMVSDYFSDFKFVNNTPFPIYIAGYANGEKIGFKIYGGALDCSYELVSKITEIIPAKTLIDKKITGSEIEIAPKNGIKSEGYLYVYRGAELVEIKLIRSDIYKAIDGVSYVD